MWNNLEMTDYLPLADAEHPASTKFPIENNCATTSQNNINEDPFGHIQWPKSAHQLDDNYGKSLFCSSKTLPHFPRYPNVVSTSTLLGPSHSRWRTCDVIPEEENMQIVDYSNCGDKYCRSDLPIDEDTLFLRPRQVQFISPKHKRKALDQHQAIGFPRDFSPVPPPRRNSSQRSIGQPKRISPEMSALIRANDGNFDGARDRMVPNDRWEWLCDQSRNVFL